MSNTNQTAGEELANALDAFDIGLKAAIPDQEALAQALEATSAMRELARPLVMPRATYFTEPAPPAPKPFAFTPSTNTVAERALARFLLRVEANFVEMSIANVARTLTLLYVETTDLRRRWLSELEILKATISAGQSRIGRPSGHLRASRAKYKSMQVAGEKLLRRMVEEADRAHATMGCWVVTEPKKIRHRWDEPVAGEDIWTVHPCKRCGIFARKLANGKTVGWAENFGAKWSTSTAPSCVRNVK